MRVKIVLDGKEEEIEVKEPTGEDQLHYYKELSKIKIDEKSKDLSDVVRLLELRDEMIVRLCPKFESVEQVRKLPLVEKEKILRVIEDRLTGRGFAEEVKNFERPQS